MKQINTTRKILLFVVAIIIATFVLISILEPTSGKPVIYHVILADPNLYHDGIFHDTIKIPKGVYQFGFVANGDSPKSLTITINDKNTYSKTFVLNGTLHQGFSNYYTWDYVGEKQLQINSDQAVSISIDPHGNTLGSLSVEIK